MSIDKFFNRKSRLKDYNCLDFCREVYLDRTGIDIGDNKLSDFSKESIVNAFEEGKVSFIRNEKPSENCIVLMERKGRIPHVGIFIDGKVLHLKRIGVRLESLSVASLGYSAIGFYVCKF